MSKTVLILSGIWMASISFNVSAATPAACQGLLDHEIAPELIAGVARAIDAKVEVSELLAARDTFRGEQARYWQQVVELESTVRSLELNQPPGSKPARALRKARARLRSARIDERSARDQVSAYMAHDVERPILEAAAEVDPYFSMLIARADAADRVVKECDEQTEILARLIAALPRATMNPWLAFKAVISSATVIPLREYLASTWPGTFEVAHHLTMTTPAPAVPKMVETLADYETLNSALIELREETRPTRDLLQARMDEVVRAVLQQLTRQQNGEADVEPAQAPVKVPRRRKIWRGRAAKSSAPPEASDENI